MDFIIYFLLTLFYFNIYFFLLFMLLYFIFIFSLFYGYKLFNWFPPNLNRHFCFVYFFTINFFKLFSTFSLLYLNCFCLFFSGLFCIFYFNFPAYWLHQGWYYLTVVWLGPPLTFRVTPMGHLFTYFGLHFYIFLIFSNTYNLYTSPPFTLCSFTLLDRFSSTMGSPSLASRSRLPRVYLPRI